MSVFSDPNVRKLLRDFIPVAEDCQYANFHRKQDERYRFFWDAFFSLPTEQINAYTDYRPPMGD